MLRAQEEAPRCLVVNLSFMGCICRLNPLQIKVSKSRTHLLCCHHSPSDGEPQYSQGVRAVAGDRRRREACGRVPSCERLHRPQALVSEGTDRLRAPRHDWLAVLPSASHHVPVPRGGQGLAPGPWPSTHLTASALTGALRTRHARGCGARAGPAWLRDSSPTCGGGGRLGAWTSALGRPLTCGRPCPIRDPACLALLGDSRVARRQGSSRRALAQEGWPVSWRTVGGEAARDRLSPGGREPGASAALCWGGASGFCQTSEEQWPLSSRGKAGGRLGTRCHWSPGPHLP